MALDDGRITADELRIVGETLYGQRWQTDLTDALGLKDSVRIRQWLSMRRPIPIGLRADLVELLRCHAARAVKLADDLEKARNPCRFEVES